MNVEQIVSKKLKRIKQLKLQIEAKKTQTEMKNFDWQRQKAIEWVEQILADQDFSFAAFAEANQLVLSYRNLETFTDEDIKDILIQHFTLKFLQDTQDDSPKS